MSDITLTIRGRTAETLQRLTEEGGYESPEAALTALLQDQAPEGDELERWLKDVVAKRLDASLADPSRVMNINEARRRLENR
jgi:hypothetical protein